MRRVLETNKFFCFTSLLLMAILFCAVSGQAKSTATTAPDTAATNATQPSAYLMKRLEKIDSRAAKVKDLTAIFIQKKYTPLLRKPIITRGNILVKPPVILWIAKKKDKATLKTRVGKNHLRILYVKKNIEEVYPLNGQLAALTSSPVPRLKVLKKLFNFSKTDTKGLKVDFKNIKTLAVKLKPKDKKLAKHIDHVRVVLDVKRGLMLVMEITPASGGRTVMRFSSIKINTDLKSKNVSLNAPKDVKIVHPLKPKKKDENS